MPSSDDKMPLAHYRSLDELESTYWWHQHRLAVSLSLLRPLGLHAPRMLDLGCGTGGFLKLLADRLGASKATGIDASPAALDYCRTKGLDARQHDLTVVMEADAPGYDLVTAMDVMEHLPDEGPLIESAAANLRESGFFLASVPAYPRLYSSWDKCLGHHRRYRRSALEALIHDAGLRIYRCTYAFSYAVLPALLRRYFGKDYEDDTCVFPETPPLVGRVLKTLGRAEAAWIRRFNVPMGLSLYVLARRGADQSPRGTANR